MDKIKRFLIGIVRFIVLLYAVMFGVNAFSEFVTLISGRFPMVNGDILIISMLLKMAACATLFFAYRWIGRKITAPTRPVGISGE